MAVEKVRFPNGEEVIFDEWLHWPVYSTLEFASLSNFRLRLFTYVQGQTVPHTGTLTARNAGPHDTNQVAKSRMNWDESYRVFSWTYEPFALSNQTIAACITVLVAPAPVISGLNLRRLQDEILAELRVGADIDKPQARCPLSYIHQGVGPVDYPCGDQPSVGIAFSAGTGGDVAWASQRRFAFPIKIGEDTPMQVILSTPRGNITCNQDVRMRWYLDGVKRRPLG